jgi:hypothetical protein
MAFCGQHHKKNGRVKKAVAEHNVRDEQAARAKPRNRQTHTRQRTIEPPLPLRALPLDAVCAATAIGMLADIDEDPNDGTPPPCCEPAGTGAVAGEGATMLAALVSLVSSALLLIRKQQQKVVKEHT